MSHIMPLYPTLSTKNWTFMIFFHCPWPTIWWSGSHIASYRKSKAITQIMDVGVGIFGIHPRFDTAHGMESGVNTKNSSLCAHPRVIVRVGISSVHPSYGFSYFVASFLCSYQIPHYVSSVESGMHTENSSLSNWLISWCCMCACHLVGSLGAGHRLT